MKNISKYRVNLANLIEIANEIPDLGQGGKTIGPELMIAAMRARKETCIIDIAPYMGSTTAFLACGAIASRKKKKIISIDKWVVDDDYIEKAEKYNKIKLKKTQDLKSFWRKNIAPFNSFPEICEIDPIKKNILEYHYNHPQRISVYVDDICNNKERHDHAMKIFSPHFIKNETLLFLMDYQFYRRSLPPLKYQRRFMNKNKRGFLNLGRIGKTMTNAFLYIGGTTRYGIDE